jgi:dsRNA-specific ribonuclease
VAGNGHRRWPTRSKRSSARLELEPIDINPKGLLQETLQAISPRSPVYELISESGREHEKTFVVRVVWEGMTLGEGTGRSKKQAETAAAQEAMLRRVWEENVTIECVQANQAASALGAEIR